MTLNATTSTYTTPATSNKLTSITNPARSFGYDAAGNTTSDSTSYTSTYSLANRLDTLTKGGTTASFSYDGMNRRVRKFVSAGTGAGAASTVVFVYDQGDQLLGEYDSAGKAIREYVWLGSTPVAVFTPDPAGSANPPLLYFIHTDHIDTPRVVVDKNNAVRWRWMAEPFGTTAPENNPSSLGAFTFNLRFPGQYANQETGLAYNLNRDYDASTGRYAQPDPIGLDGGSASLYAYVSGNPLSGVDPSGLQGVAPTPWGPLPLPVPLPSPLTPSPRPVDPAEPYGPQYTPGPRLPSIPDWLRNWMDSRADSEPKLPIVNPGRDCNGNCNPCPPGKTWRINKPGHGWPNWYEHRIDYNQNKQTCICYPDRPSTGLVGG